MPTYIFGEGPTATVSGTHKDTYIDRFISANDAFGTEATLLVDNGDGALTLMRFDISSIPAGETIASAVLTLYVNFAPFGGSSLSAHRLTTNWGVTNTAEGASESPAASSQATNARAFANPTDTPWAVGAGGSLAAGDYDGVAEATTAMTGAEGAGDPITWDLATAVGEWHAGAQPNYGIVLIGNNANQGTFDSQESVTAAERPLLTVVTTGGAVVAGSAARHSPSRLSLNSGLSL